MTASDHTFASIRKPFDTGVSINGLSRVRAGDQMRFKIQPWRQAQTGMSWVRKAVDTAVCSHSRYGIIERPKGRAALGDLL